jgi:signal transduction histidine kinase
LLLEDKWSEKELELDPVLDPVSFYGDRELMQQVWINLFSNAIRFSKKGGKIQIGLTANSDHVVFSVADQGIGIPEEAKAHIFEKFYKVDKSRSDEGNGLGLAIVKKIVELHKGKVSFVSREGRGTEFMVELPYEH